MPQQFAAVSDRSIRMDETKSPKSTEHDPPQPPNNRSEADKRYGQCYSLPESQVNRYHLPEIQSCQSDGAAAMEIHALEEHNRQLKAEMGKHYRLQRISRKLLEEVRASTKQLKDAVLEFRQAHKYIEESFREEEEFHEEEFLSTHHF